MSNIAGATVGTTVDPALTDNPGADPGTDLDKDEVVHSASRTSMDFA
jgi:hypothetical protein